MNNHKAVIVGDNHHNALNLARSFGVNNIKPVGFIICDKKKELFVDKSKYWNEVYILSSYNDLIINLINVFKNEKYKSVLLPCSDTAAMLVDANLDILSQYFILPSLNSRQGAITKLMDKEEQVYFAQENGISIADTWVIKVENWESIVDEIVYPCIVKPVSSYEGKKSDIKKCDNINELISYLKIIFEIKHYSRILVQKFIKFDYEIEFVGSINGDSISYLTSRTIRSWPIIGGTNSYFQIINNSSINTIINQIIEVFQKKNYSGLFDIELFNVGGQIYLNEINWRNTGNSFFALGTDVHYAVVWYLSVTGADSYKLSHFCTDESQFAMNEATDLRYVFFNHFSFKTWNYERKHTQSFALWFKGDNKPTRKRYMYLLKKLISNKRVKDK